MEFRQHGILPGSIEERRFSHYLLSRLKDHVDWAKTINFPVYSWRGECTLEISGETYNCAALPYSPPVEVEVNSMSIKLLNSLADIHKLVNDSIVVVKYPESYTELRWLHYVLSSRGIKLVVFYTNGDYVKADTVLGTPGFTFNPSTPPSTPAICVSSGIARLITGRSVRVRVESSLSSSEASIIIAGINGRGEGEVHVVGYHDVLIGKYTNTSSSILCKLARYLKKSSLQGNIVLVSYSARELGDKQFTEYHYTWGLRYLLKLLESRGELSRVHSALALGPLHSTRRIRVVTHPVLKNIPVLEKTTSLFELSVDHNHALLESHVYVSNGIPAITLTTLPYSWWCHNSTLNCTQTDLGEDALSLIARLASSLVEYDYSVSTRELDNYVVSTVGESTLEARSTAFRIKSLTRILNTHDYVREATRLGYGIFYSMCSDPFSVTFSADLLVEISEKSLSTLRSVLEKCAGEVVVGNSEWYLTARISKGFSSEIFLKSYIEKIVKKRNSLIDSSVIRYLCEKALRGSYHGVEEHRNR